MFQANITGIDVNTTIPNTIEYLGPLYKDTYIPTVSGNYSIVVFSLSPKAGIIRTLEACIRNTPTYIDIPLQPCLSCVDTFGPGVTVAVSSTQEQQNAFFILTRDCSGNPLGVGGAEFDIGVFYKNQQLTSFVNPSVLDLNNGIYYVQYYAQLDGPVDMVIKMNTSSGYQPITGSPFRIYFEQGSGCLSYNNCTQNGWCQSGACNCLNGWPNNNPECAICNKTNFFLKCIN